MNNALQNQITHIDLREANTSISISIYEWPNKTTQIESECVAHAYALAYDPHIFYFHFTDFPVAAAIAATISTHYAFGIAYHLYIYMCTSLLAGTNNRYLRETNFIYIANVQINFQLTK